MADWHALERGNAIEMLASGEYEEALEALQTIQSRMRFETRRRGGLGGLCGPPSTPAFCLRRLGRPVTRRLGGFGGLNTLAGAFFLAIPAPELEINLISG